MPVNDIVQFDRQMLVAARAARFLERRELADAAGVSVGTVQRAHDGANVSVKKAKLIAKALRVPLRELIVSEPESPTAKRTPGKDVGGAVGCLDETKQREGARDG